MIIINNQSLKAPFILIVFGFGCLLVFVSQHRSESADHHCLGPIPVVSETSQEVLSLYQPIVAIMNVLPTASGRKSTVNTTTSSKLLDTEQRHLNFYTEPLTVELSIDDFEVFALKRLKVCSYIHQLDEESVIAPSWFLLFVVRYAIILLTTPFVLYPTGPQKD